MKGTIFFYQRKTPEVENCLDTVLAIANQFKIKESKCLALSGLSSVYLRKKKPEIALNYALKALAVKGKFQLFVYNDLYETLASAYMALKNYDMAMVYLQKQLKICEQTKFTPEMVQINSVLSDLYEQTKNYQKALEYYKDFVAMKDSMSDKEVAENINKLEIKYSTAQKDKEIATQHLLLNQKENNLKEKNLWIWGIAALSVVLASMLFTLFRNYQRRHQLQETIICNLEQQQKISVLTAIMQGEEKERTRMARELHDGVGGLLSAAKMNFNSLHHLYDESPVFHNGIKLLDEAYDELRKTAHNMLPEVLLHEGLAKAVMLYCNKIDRQLLDISFQAIEEIPRLDAQTELSIYRVIQELINNVLKHAKATKALVQIDVEDDQLFITIEDNGAGIPGRIADGKAEAGMGLKNISSRINALGGQMDVDSRPDVGTTVYLEFNIHQFQKLEVA